MGAHSNEFIQACRQRLLQMKADLLNRMSAKWELSVQDKMQGDEVDQTSIQTAENLFALHQSRVRHQLLEVELALVRIQRGSFGICEETEEPIEKERLLALPFTRFSIEGAELREAVEKRFATKSL